MVDYAVGRLRHALERALTADDVGVRRRAAARVDAWRNVLDGMASGRLTVGSRTPVAETPAWVTLEVLEGGFASGRYLAETPLREDELARMPENGPGVTDRERLNLWFLTDAGLAELGEALRSGCYRVELPEESAFLVVAWLLEHDHHAAALELVSELRPLMHRLRFTPVFSPSSAPSGAMVRLLPVGEVKDTLRKATVRPQIAAQRTTLAVWNPLYDRLVALWFDTVDGEAPDLDADRVVTGGWPCQVWPDDWSERRSQWLDEYRAAAEQYGDHQHPRSNFARLRTALERCPHDSSALTARDVGWIRRALANTIQAHGTPCSAERTALRTIQQSVAARPTYASLAHILSGRLDQFPAKGGLPALEPIAGEVTGAESVVAAGAAIPDHLLAKAARALEAPIGELVDRGVIGSGEVLAKVLPQITAQLLAANITDPALAAVYSRTYAAFRRRRSLLLLNLEHQVRFDELPWVSAIAPYRDRRQRAAGETTAQTMREATVLALTAFPWAILPNPLVREFRTLAEEASLGLPLVEEAAADIFMGTFTMKWRDAATVASRLLDGTLYAHYFDLPSWPVLEQPKRWRLRRPTAEDFAALCRLRAGGGGRSVAHNGTVLEQSQILTTQNLAVLVDGLQLTDWLRSVAPSLAERTFGWVAQRETQLTTLRGLKNIAYAWRQAIFYLSFCDTAQQQEVLAELSLGPRLNPALTGLVRIADGQRFDADGRVGDGRRLLGWSVGPHWALTREDVHVVGG
jgi:hypothetical protein